LGRSIPVIVMLLAWTSLAPGQESPTAPMSKVRLATFAVFGAEALADGITTRVLYQRNHSELDPIAKPFVQAGVSGQISAGLLGVAAISGAWFVLHRSHHENTAKWFLLTVTAGEGCNVARQFAVLRKSRE
jgi:hypothetical protein